MTNWFCNNGDGLTTGYWAIAPWQRATSYATGAIVRQTAGAITFGIALDMTHGNIWWKDLTGNGYWNDTAGADPGSNVGGIAHSITGALFPAITVYNYTILTCNFGASSFLGTLPTGFSSANTAAGTTVTLNPSDCSANITLSGGNLIATGNTNGSNNNWYSVRATASFSTGLIYWEVQTSWQIGMGTYGKNGNFQIDWMLGVANATASINNYIGVDTNGVSWWLGGSGSSQIRRNNASVQAMHSVYVPPGNERAFRNAGSTFTSGNTFPSWNLGANNTTTDGTGTWTEITGLAAYGWLGCGARMDAMSSKMVAFDTCYVGDNHTQLELDGKNLQIGPNNGNWEQIWYSMDHTVASPTAANLKPGATIGYSQSYGTISGNWVLIGFTITTTGNSAATTSIAGGGNVNRFVNCTFNNSGTYSSSFGGWQFGNNTGFVTLENCTVISTAPQATFGCLGAKFIMRGGSFSVTGSGKNVFQGNTSARANDYIFDNVDFSGVTGVGAQLYDTGGNLLAAGTTFLLTRCKVPSATFLQVIPSDLHYPEVIWYNCDAGTDQQSHGRADSNGVQVNSHAVIRTGGATDGLATFSEQITTTANPIFYRPFRGLPMEIWSSTTGTNRTITIYAIANTTAMPTNADLWMRARYLGNASSVLGTEVSTAAANGLVTPTNYAADTSAWDTGTVVSRVNGETVAVGAIRKVSSNTGRIFFCTAISTGILSGSLPGGYATAVDGGTVTDGGATFMAGWRFSMVLTLTSPAPQLAGLITAQLEVARPSTIVFFDPLSGSSLV